MKQLLPVTGPVDVKNRKKILKFLFLGGAVNTTAVPFSHISLTSTLELLCLMCSLGSTVHADYS